MLRSGAPVVAEKTVSLNPGIADVIGAKEDAVREEVVFPLLVRLGYASANDAQIIRSKPLSHPFVMIGTTRRPITMVPDYVLAVGGTPQWVLDAKSPKEQITSGRNVEQVFSYAIHPDIRAQHYALCNGREFALFAVDSRDPLLHFPLAELESHWPSIHNFLGPQAFRATAARTPAEPQRPALDYLTIAPPREITRIQKQAAKRHHGVHGYFTRQVWAVVRKYIETFTRPGDLVLDPFGGSGVTFIEALLLGRKVIHIDINPLSTFIVETMVSRVDPGALTYHFDVVMREVRSEAPA